MAFYEAPSFSLGLDFDFDSDPHIPIPNCATQTPASDCSVRTGVADCIGKLKRFNRGSAGCSSEAKKNESSPLFSVVDDDIEEISSQEDCHRADRHPSPLFQSVCSSSKVPPLHGILTALTSSQLKAKKDKQTVDAPTSVDSEKQNKSLFPNLTISPLRKFQLLESDLDEPSSCDNQSRKGHETASSLNKQKSTFGPFATNNSSSSNELMDKLSCSAHYYFFHDDPRIQKLVRNRLPNFSMDNHTNSSSCSNELMELSCPAHYYFFHDDPRIHKLVRNHFPEFCPLGVDGSRASLIDYMGQFSSGEASTSRPLQVNKEKSSKSSINISKGSKINASKHGANEKTVSPLSSKKKHPKGSNSKK